MSSTDSNDALAASIFEQLIKPIADDLQRKKRALLTPGPDTSATSYFDRPERTRMSPEDFELSALDSPAAFVRALGDRWAREGLTELTALVPQLEVLAERYASEPAAESDSVNPFIYTMF